MIVNKGGSIREGQSMMTSKATEFGDQSEEGVTGGILGRVPVPHVFLKPSLTAAGHYNLLLPSIQFICQPLY